MVDVIIKPYVYKCTHKTTNEFYFGYRCANKVPAHEDLGIIYFTSSKYVKPRFNEFEYEIIAEFDNREDALEFEQLLIIDNINNKKIINKAYWQNHIITEQEYNNPSRVKKISDAKKLHFAKTGYNPMNYQIHREKVRKSKLGDKNPMFGNSDASKHLNNKVCCIDCGYMTNKSNIIHSHGNGICNKLYEILDTKNNISYNILYGGLSIWCNEFGVNRETVKYAIRVSGKFLNRYKIKEL